METEFVTMLIETGMKIVEQNLRRMWTAIDVQMTIVLPVVALIEACFGDVCF